METARLTACKISAHGLSDIGLVRHNNEDIWAQLADDAFFILADGMGGHQGGEVAARETVTNMCRLVRKKITPLMTTSSLDQISDLIRRAIRHVNAGVYQMSRAQEDLRGMGTTVCCLLFHEAGLIYAHVGDSRIYRYRNFELEQLTKDHSLVTQLIDQGQLSACDAINYAHKNIITKAIGTEPKVEPSVGTTATLYGDLYLMCSDGLSDLITHEEIAEIISTSPSVEATVANLVGAANSKGGVDNTTVVIVKVENPKETNDSPSPQYADNLSR